MAPATALQDELAEEILLRLPPEDPALLVRAALVCKHSCRLVADPGFRRRFREFHGAPPMLGFFRNTRRLRATGRERARFVFGEADAEPPTFARFVSTSSLRLPRAKWRSHWRVVDARHGRVLLVRKTQLGNNHFHVWHPITDEKRDLGILPGFLYLDSFNAVVFCADAGCSHLDCRHNPFTVVYVSITKEMKVCDYIYSSEAVQWHRPSTRSMPYAAAQQDDYLDLGPCVLVGNLLYFLIETNTRILEYNVATREMGVVHLPPGCSSERRIMLMTAEDGCLGFATVHKSKLCLWSKENGSDEDAGWTQMRVINLKKLLSVRSLSTSPRVVGFANGIGVIFVHTYDGLFTIDLNSSRVKKVQKASDSSKVFPYMSYCTPALRAATTSTDEGPTMGASSPSEA